MIEERGSVAEMSEGDEIYACAREYQQLFDPRRAVQWNLQRVGAVGPDES